MKQCLFLLVFLPSISLFGQQRLELLETNVAPAQFGAYGDSYLWTKNWWLTSSMLVDIARGGNAIAEGSKLSKAKVDSLGKVFRQYLSPDLIRFGKLVPRIEYTGNKKSKPFIRSSVYEVKGDSVKLLGQFYIEFGTGSHNNMTDVFDVTIMDPKTVTAFPSSIVTGWIKRAATPQERELIGPEVEGLP